ncbi:MAG TPA: hypothetical protein VFQ60_03595 [Patescibacteria group bacterium]|nr:hypothetical protein [Patescibacteria group bacterium]
MPARTVRIICRGVTSEHKPALPEPGIEADISVHSPPGAQMIGVEPLACPHNGGGHSEYCLASGATGKDRPICPYSFDFPYIQNFDHDWKPPVAIQSALDAIVAENSQPSNSDEKRSPSRKKR